MRLTPLDGESCDAVGLLAAASVALREVLWGDETGTTAPHIAARFHADAAQVAEHSWTLASLVIRREEFDAALLPATDRDGKPVFAWHPVPEVHTFVELLDPLFESAEHVARGARLSTYLSCSEFRSHF